MRHRHDSNRTRSTGLIALLCAIALAALASPASATTTRPPLPFSPIDGSGIGATLHEPSGIAIDEATGNFFLNDGHNENVLHILGAEGGPPSGLAAPFQLESGFSFVFSGTGNAFDNSPASPNQDTLYVGDNNNDVVKKFARNPATEHYEAAGQLSATAPAFNGVGGVAVDAQGNVFATDVSHAYVVKFNPAGAQVQRINLEPAKVGFTRSVAVDAAGDLFVQGSDNVVKYPAGPGGAIDAKVFTEVYRQEPGLPQPLALAVDPATNALFIAFPGRIVEYDATSLAKRLDFGTGVLSIDFGNDYANTLRLAVDSSNDRIYASDARADNVAAFGPAAKVAGVEVSEPTQVKPTSAILHGTVNPDGLAVSECLFEWGETNSFGETDFDQVTPCEGAIPADSADHAVSAPLTGLDVATKYRFRLAVKDSSGNTNRSTSIAFQTGSQALTEAATDVKGTKATLNAALFPAGAPIAECLFEWGTTTAYGKTAPCEPEAGSIPADEAEHHVSAALTHLKPNGTTYHFRIRAQGSVGLSQGFDATFKTKDTVISTPPSDVGADSATLNGTLNPEGILYSECRFEWGATTAYGNSAPCTQTPAQIGSGAEAVPVSAELSGLETGLTYHYRLIGVNVDGEAKGEDQVLKTLAKPQLEAQWAQDVARFSATVKAQINPEGLPTTYRVEYGTDASYGQSSAELGLGASDRSGHTVGLVLEGLIPDTTYHYRFTATSELGSSEGEDHTFITYGPTVPETDCPNQAFRLGSGADLPDCRAYELVSPLDKGGAGIDVNPGVVNDIAGARRQASLDGERLAFTARNSFGDALRASLSNEYLASRGPAGWTTHALDPSRDGTIFGIAPAAPYELDGNFLDFSDDLCTALMRDQNAVPLSADAIHGTTNLYRRDNCGPGADTYQALTTGALPAFSRQAPEDPLSLFYASFSGDGSHMVFRATAALESSPAPAPTAKGQLYDFSAGQLHLVSVLPGGEAAAEGAGLGRSFGGLEGSYATLEGAISEDGSRIFWTAGGNAGSPGDLYVRLDGQRTLLIANAARFLSAASDGGAVIYRQGGNEGGGGSLFEFDLDQALAEEEAGAASQAAREASTSEIAGEVGGLVGAGEDLSHQYFTSKEALGGENERGEEAVAGEWNLYLRQGGAMSFIATLAPADRGEGIEIPVGAMNTIDRDAPVLHSSRVTPDGRRLIFMSVRPLTGYDNADAVSGEAASEIFRYDAEGGHLACVSCNPSGARPLGRKVRPAYLPLKSPGLTKLQAAAWIPTSERSTYAKRSLSADGGRVFFNSFDPLVLGDTNGVQDVYQWEAPGSGSCETDDAAYSDLNSGCISLISTGQSDKESEFLDASADGRDVFFTTSSSIHPRDLGFIDIYDARAGGGLPFEEQPPAECEGEACQSPPAPPNDPTPASAAFRGAGNLGAKARKRQCPKGRVRRGKGRCVQKHQRSKPSKQRRANRNRGGAK